MTLYRTSNQPRHRLAHVGRWLLAVLLWGAAVLLADTAVAVWTGAASIGVDAPWLVTAAGIAVWFAALAVPPPLARATTPIALPPPAPDCIAPTAAYVTGADLVMTPQALEELWRADPHRPPHDWVVRPAVPDAGDEQAGDGRG